jgi:hypothetical protein
MLDSLFDLPVLHNMIKGGQGAQMFRVGREALHGRVNGIAVRGHDRELLQLHEGSDPFFRPGLFLFRGDPLQGREGKLISLPDGIVNAVRAETLSIGMQK